VQLPRGFHLLRVDARPSKEEIAQVGRQWVARPLAVHEQAEVLARQFAEALQSELRAGKPMQEALDDLTQSSVKAGSAALAAAPAGAVQASEIEAAALESRARPELTISPSFTRIGIQNPIPGAPSAKQLAFTLKEVGDVYPESIPTKTGFAIMQLKDKEPAQREDFEKEKHDFMAEVTERAKAEAVTAFVARLRKARETEITVNQRYLEEKASTEDDS